MTNCFVQTNTTDVYVDS